MKEKQREGKKVKVNNGERKNETLGEGRKANIMFLCFI
jgi:hypothetical protein